MERTGEEGGHKVPMPSPDTTDDSSDGNFLKSEDQNPASYVDELDRLAQAISKSCEEPSEPQENGDPEDPSEPEDAEHEETSELEEERPNEILLSSISSPLSDITEDLVDRLVQDMDPELADRMLPVLLEMYFRRLVGNRNALRIQIREAVDIMKKRNRKK